MILTLEVEDLSMGCCDGGFEFGDPFPVGRTFMGEFGDECPDDAARVGIWRFAP